MFIVTLGNYKKYSVDFELQEYTNPICSIPYPVPKVHKEIFEKKVEYVVLLGLPEISNISEWGTLSFTQPKP